MDTIVFDLETIKTFQKGEFNHIIEISATKTNLLMNNPNIIDTFQQYVLPPYGHIRKSSRKMIGITKEEMYKAISLQEAMNKFSEWIGENSYLCSWSDSDAIILMKNYEINPFNISWFRNFNDIQKPISRVLSDYNDIISLSKAMELASIKKEGHLHSGLFDAINTTKILIKYKNYVKLEQNSINDIFRSELYKKCKNCGEMRLRKLFKRSSVCRICKNINKIKKYDVSTV